MTFCLMSSPCLPSASHPLQFNLSSLSFTNSNRTNRKIHKIYFFICHMRSEKMKSKPKKSACKSYRSGKLRKASPNEQGNCFTRPIMTTWSKQWLTTSNGEPQMLSPQSAVILLCEGPGGVQKIRAGVKGSYVDTAAAHLFLNLRMNNRCSGSRGGIFFPV